VVLCLGRKEPTRPKHHPAKHRQTVSFPVSLKHPDPSQQGSVRLGVFSSRTPHRWRRYVICPEMHRDVK